MISAGIFFKYLAKCICEINCLAQDGFDLNAVHKLSIQEKEILAKPGFKLWAAGWEARILPMCYAATPSNNHYLFKLQQLLEFNESNPI